MNKFNVGDVVFIKSSSVFFGENTDRNPNNLYGEITQMYIDVECGFEYGVKWSNNCTNVYRAGDLELAGFIVKCEGGTFWKLRFTGNTSNIKKAHTYNGNDPHLTYAKTLPVEIIPVRFPVKEVPKTKPKKSNPQLIKSLDKLSNGVFRVSGLFEGKALLVEIYPIMDIVAIYPINDLVSTIRLDKFELLGKLESEEIKIMCIERF